MGVSSMPSHTHWDVSCDPIFVGGQNDELFSCYSRDPIAFCIYVVIRLTIIGAKPAQAAMWVINRILNDFHYSVGNMEWIAQADNVHLDATPRNRWLKAR